MTMILLMILVVRIRSRIFVSVVWGLFVWFDLVLSENHYQSTEEKRKSEYPEKTLADEPQKNVAFKFKLQLRLELTFGGRNSSVGSVLGSLSCLMQRRGFGLPLSLG